MAQGLHFENRSLRVSAVSCLLGTHVPTNSPSGSGAHSSSCWEGWQLTAYNGVLPRNCPSPKEATQTRFHASVHGQPIPHDWSTGRSKVLASIEDTLRVVQFQGSLGVPTQLSFPFCPSCFLHPLTATDPDPHLQDQCHRAALPPVNAGNEMHSATYHTC